MGNVFYDDEPYLGIDPDINEVACVQWLEHPGITGFQPNVWKRDNLCGSPLKRNISVQSCHIFCVHMGSQIKYIV